MNRLKLVLPAFAVLALSFGLVACGGDDDDEGAPAPEAQEASFDLTVGDLVPLTGDLSQFGPSGRKAADLAVEQATDALEQAGVDQDITVSVEHADTETSPQAAQSAARQLISDGASCLAGAWGSANTIPVGRSVAARQQVPQISPASTSPEITDLPDDGFVFRTAPSDALQGQVLADTVEQELGSTDATISLAARNDAYGEGIINQFQTSWEEKGGQTTGPVLYDPEQSSYNSEAGQIVEGDPDAFVIIDFEEPYNQVGAALVRTGDFDPSNLFTADGLAFDEIPDSIPADALDGATGTRPASPEGTEARQAFDDLFKEEGGPAQETFAPQNFDAVMLCILASIAAGSSEGPDIQEQILNVANEPGTQYNYTQLSDAITALRDGEDINYEGVSGPVELDDNGDPTVGFYEVFRYEDGSLVVDRQVEQESEEAEDTEDTDAEETEE